MRTPFRLPALVASLVLLLATAPDAGRFVVPCETYAGNNDTGATPIACVGCTYALTGIAVVGVDLVGEWIELPFVAPIDGLYTLTLRSHSTTNQWTTMKATIVGTDQSTTFVFVGTGCG